MTQRDPLHIGLDTAGMKSRTVGGAAVTAAAQVAKFGLQMGTQIVLARMLDPAQFGLVAMVAPVLGLALALNDCGLGQAIVQRTDLTHRQVSAMFWINLCIGAVMTAVAMLFAPLVALFYGEPRTMGITVASASLIFLSSLAVVPLALLNRQMRYSVLAAVEVTSMTLGLASGIVAAWLGAGYWALVLMQAVNVLATVIGGWACCGWMPQRPAREPGVGALMRFGANVMGASVASQLSMSAAQVIVGAVNGKVALGLYDRSYNLVVKPLWQLMAPFSRVAVPLLSRLQTAPDRYGRAYLLMLQVMHIACLPGLVAACVMSDTLIAVLLGPKWAAMAPVFFWIGLGGIFSALAASTAWLFTSQARTPEQMRWGVANALISVAAFAFGTQWGVVGVACVSATVFVVLQTPMVVWAATRRGPVSLAMLCRGMLPLGIAALLAAVATVALTRAEAGLSGIVQLALSFLASYAVFLLALLVQPAGRRMLGDALASVPRRRSVPPQPHSPPHTGAGPISP